MKVCYQIDRRIKFRFCLRILFDFLDISAMNSKIIYEKIDSAVGISAMDFCLSLACSMTEKVSKRKRAAPMHRPSKKFKGESFDTVGHLPEFSAACAHFTLCSSKKNKNRTFICPLSCNVPLCLQKERNRFYLRHHKQ